MIILDLLEASIGYNYKLIIFDTQLDPIHTPNNHQDKHNGEIKCPRRVYIVLSRYVPFNQTYFSLQLSD